MTPTEALAHATREVGITPQPHGVNTGMVLAGLLIDALPRGWRLMDGRDDTRMNAPDDASGTSAGEFGGRADPPVVIERRHEWRVPTWSEAMEPQPDLPLDDPALVGVCARCGAREYAGCPEP